MATRTLDCPTCGTMQAFRLLDPAEKAAVREKEGPGFYVGNLWRCTAKGCLTYYPQFHKAGHGRLPERFAEEEAAAE
ncbi:hypothetical protein ACHBTE_13395 [Streptomyces sp. M41]|uniref:hypothetical protein n=1 Tax=Streptomyces sp. M41 TaxID=3059412 RepID=UPI00374D07DC